MKPARSPICLGCNHFNAGGEAGLTCKAFPLGIPDDILYSAADHRKPFPGDNGIRFEPIDAAAARRADEIFG